MNDKKGIYVIIACFLIASIFNKSFAQSIGNQPNIVLILADDLALMDFGSYGGEAATPIY